MNAPYHFSVGFLLPGAKLEHREGPTHPKVQGLLPRLAQQRRAGRARLRLPNMLVCPQASTVPPGKFFPTEEKFHFRTEIFGGDGMGSCVKLSGREIKNSVDQQR